MVVFFSKTSVVRESFTSVIVIHFIEGHFIEVNATDLAAFEAESSRGHPDSTGPDAASQRPRDLHDKGSPVFLAQLKNVTMVTKVRQMQVRHAEWRM